MSHQPSTSEKVANKAGDAYAAVTGTAEDGKEEAPKGEFDGYKEALREAAHPKPEPKPSVLDTVKSYIPGLAPKEEPSARKEPDEGTRPQRPGDDPKVEGFLRGVYATGNEVGDGKNGGK